MPLQIAGQTGPQVVNDGGDVPLRQGRLADLIVSELQGRFYEANFRNALFSGGISTLTSISNVTFTTATLGATETPIIGLWNPANSGVNAVILQAVLAITLTALQATGAGPFVWAVANSQNGITTGNQPLSRKTLNNTGSACKDMSGVALTGLGGNMALKFGSGLSGGAAYNASLLATAAGFQTQLAAFTENFDGGLFVPPGCVLALLATTTPVAHSAVSSLIWTEVAI